MNFQDLLKLIESKLVNPNSVFLEEVGTEIENGEYLFLTKIYTELSVEIEKRAKNKKADLNARISAVEIEIEKLQEESRRLGENLALKANSRPDVQIMNSPFFKNQKERKFKVIWKKKEQLPADLKKEIEQIGKRDSLSGWLSGARKIDETEFSKIVYRRFFEYQQAEAEYQEADSAHKKIVLDLFKALKIKEEIMVGLTDINHKVSMDAIVDKLNEVSSQNDFSNAMRIANYMRKMTELGRFFKISILLKERTLNEENLTSPISRAIEEGEGKIKLLNDSLNSAENELKTAEGEYEGIPSTKGVTDVALISEIVSWRDSLDEKINDLKDKVEAYKTRLQNRKEEFEEYNSRLVFMRENKDVLKEEAEKLIRLIEALEISPAIIQSICYFEEGSSLYEKMQSKMAGYLKNVLSHSVNNFSKENERAIEQVIADGGQVLFFKATINSDAYCRRREVASRYFLSKYISKYLPFLHVDNGDRWEEDYSESLGERVYRAWLPADSIYSEGDLKNISNKFTRVISLDSIKDNGCDVYTMSATLDITIK